MDGHLCFSHFGSILSPAAWRVDPGPLDFGRDYSLICYIWRKSFGFRVWLWQHQRCKRRSEQFRQMGDRPASKIRRDAR